MSSRRFGWRAFAARAWLGIAVTGVSGCATAGHDRPPVRPEVAAEPDCQKDDTANHAITVPGDVPLGCVNRANLRAMVANQQDLDHGQVLAPASGAQEARGVEAYKKGEVKKLNPTDDSGSSTPAQPPETP